jgi:hypothetical protein
MILASLVSFTSWMLLKCLQEWLANAQTKQKTLNAQRKHKRSYINFFAKVQMLKQNKEAYIDPRKKKEKKLAPCKCDLPFEFQQWINDGTCHWKLGVDILFVGRASSVRS